LFQVPSFIEQEVNASLSSITNQMTPNDAQIDLLLRRHAGQVKSKSETGQHLDADELNAFAEGSLPAAARSRYVSHLVDCDDCRKVASQLAIMSGAVVAAEAVGDSQGYPWWKRLSGFFSPLTLRYAAFAVVLVAVVGVVFLVTRRPRESALIAQRESAEQPQVSAVKPAETTSLPAGADQNAQTYNRRSESGAPVAATPMPGRPDESKVAASSAPPPPKPEQETLKAASPTLAGEKTAEPKALPSYAPPPPGEITSSGTVLSERQALPGEVASGPRKSESTFGKSKMMDRSRASDMPKDARAQDDNNRAGVSQPQANVQREADEKAAPGRGGDALSSRDRNARESRARAPATQSAGTEKQAPAEEAPETRSVGGRKFRRQGSAWVDAKFKSSMTLKSISRGSGEFAALDSGLRSIAQQISGEVIVVWKNKAYLIH
jgi:hypothetical protein